MKKFLSALSFAIIVYCVFWLKFEVLKLGQYTCINVTSDYHSVVACAD